METLPIDLLRLTYEYLDDASLAHACMINSSFSRKICNNNFWINKIINKYSLSIEEIDKYKGNNTYWSYYLFLSDNVENQDTRVVLVDAAARGRLDLVKIAIDRGGYSSDEDIYIYNDAITDAAFHGNDDIVLYILNQNQNIDKEDALIYATMGDQKSTIKLFLDRGADIHYNFDEPLRSAAEDENIGLVEFLLRNGADPTAVGYTDNPYINMLLDQYEN